MTRSSLSWLIALGLTAAIWAASAYLYPGLPDRIPTHWNIHGKVDGYGSKTWAVFLMPAVCLLMLGLFRLLPWLSPKGFQVDTFRPTYEFIMVGVVGLFCYIHAVILYATLRHVAGNDQGFDMGRALCAGIFLFFALLGNVMGKVRRNFYMGVRVPWTLASERVWNDTHRVAAWTMVGGGLLGFLIVVSGLPIAAGFGVLIASVIVPVVYSFVHYKSLERRGAL
jgi:uncharacterized membrane protein